MLARALTIATLAVLPLLAACAKQGPAQPPANDGTFLVSKDTSDGLPDFGPAFKVVSSASSDGSGNVRIGVKPTEFTGPDAKLTMVFGMVAAPAMDAAAPAAEVKAEGAGNTPDTPLRLVEVAPGDTVSSALGLVAARHPDRRKQRAVLLHKADDTYVMAVQFVSQNFPNSLFFDATDWAKAAGGDAMPAPAAAAPAVAPEPATTEAPAAPGPATTTGG